MPHHGQLPAGGRGQGTIAVFAIMPAPADLGCGGRPPGANSVCPGHAGTAAGRADFGPDYHSPSLASLRPWRLCAPSHATPAEDTVPGQGRKTARTPEVTSLVRALALHGVARPSPGRKRSHLACPLRPGRGVLIRSVSRRLGSVACVREDASPNEVSGLTNLRMPVQIPGCQTGGAFRPRNPRRRGHAPPQPFCGS